VNDLASLILSVRSVAFHILPSIEEGNRFVLSSFHVMFLA
jgi:hypothetical protein